MLRRSKTARFGLISSSRPRNSSNPQRRSILATIPSTENILRLGCKTRLMQTHLFWACFFSSLFSPSPLSLLPPPVCLPSQQFLTFTFFLLHLRLSLTICSFTLTQVQWPDTLTLLFFVVYSYSYRYEAKPFGSRGLLDHHQVQHHQVVFRHLGYCTSSQPIK